MMATGSFWRSDQFGTYTMLPKDAHNGGLDWDTAYTQEEDNSASAYVRSYRGMAPPDRPTEFPIYIDDVGWDWLEFPGLVAWVKSLTGPHFVEKKATGKSVVQVLKTYGIKAEEVIVEGDKLARASIAQPVAATGRIYVNERVHKKLLFGERQGLLRVTAEALQMGRGAEGLDVNDAFVQAIHRHTGVSGMGKRFPLVFG
jgi:phage terminase large subunit-like protein